MSNTPSYGITAASAQELEQAVQAELLSQDEARLVYWSQFPVLQASVTPPAIGGTTNA